MSESRRIIGYRIERDSEGEPVKVPVYAEPEEPPEWGDEPAERIAYERRRYLRDRDRGSSGRGGR